MYLKKWIDKDKNYYLFSKQYKNLLILLEMLWCSFLAFMLYFMSLLLMEVFSSQKKKEKEKEEIILHVTCDIHLFLSFLLERCTHPINLNPQSHPSPRSNKGSIDSRYMHLKFNKSQPLHNSYFYFEDDLVIQCRDHLTHYYDPMAWTSNY